MLRKLPVPLLMKRAAVTPNGRATAAFSAGVVVAATVWRRAGRAIVRRDVRSKREANIFIDDRTKVFFVSKNGEASRFHKRNFQKHNPCIHSNHIKCTSQYAHCHDKVCLVNRPCKQIPLLSDSKECLQSDTLGSTTTALQESFFDFFRCNVL